jgi:hypothetical protein
MEVRDRAMGIRVDIKDDKYILTSSFNNAKSDPMTRKQAVAELVGNSILKHRMDVLETYMTFPYQYANSKLQVHVPDDLKDAKSDHLKIYVYLCGSDGWWEMSKKLYETVLEILEDEDKEYVPYMEIPLIAEIIEKEKE